jgi:serine/threonine protein kinase
MLGEVVLGRYRIDRVLGQGGMGQVVAATDLMTDRQVALKLLTSERTGDPTAAARMMREAMVATKLGGRHTGRIFDAGLHDNGQPILVLELLDGEDLAQRLARVGPLPEPEAIAMTLDACEGLAEAHAIRLIHRDIKPSNLFVAIDVGGESVVKVIDFGAAKLDPSRGDTLTMTTTVIGSVAYMAPEQLRKLEVDERTDLKSNWMAAPKTIPKASAMKTRFENLTCLAPKR